MADQLARGIFANFRPGEHPFDAPNGMEDNLRLIDDHLGLYSLAAPIAPGSALPESVADGAGQIFTDGSYAVFNAGMWMRYPARKGISAALQSGFERWLNNGETWVPQSKVVADLIAPLVEAAASFRDQAEAARDLALMGTIWPTTAAGIGQGVAGIQSLVGGSGGTNGTHPLGFSGGAQVLAPVGRFIVAGGVVVSVAIDYPGYYSAGTPTLSFAASSGLTGASATAVMGANTPVGKYFAVVSTVNAAALDVYQVATGPAATYKFSTPSNAAVIDALARTPILRQELTLAGLGVYTGAGSLIPLVLDALNQVLLGYDTENEALVGAGLITLQAVLGEVNRRLGEVGQANYIGGGPVFPWYTDPQARVLLGADTDRNCLTGLPIGPEMMPAGFLPPATLEDLATKPVAKAVNHLLGYGDSTSVGAATAAVLSTTQSYSNITFQGGPRAAADSYAPFKALVEDAVSPAPDGGTNRQETFLAGAANFASTMFARGGGDPSNHVILGTTAGHGSYTIDELRKGSGWYAQILAHATQAKALNADYAVHAVAYVEGANSVAAAISYATYLAKLNQLQADLETDLKAISGQTSPIYMLITQCAYGTGAFSDIARAQLKAAQTNPKIILTTPMYHIPHAGDQVHQTAVGTKWMGAYIGRAYSTMVHRGKRPKFLNPVSATLRGSEVRIRFDVPHPPMVLDDVNFATTTDMGFYVDANGSKATISRIAIDGAEVVLTLASPPALPVTARYAHDYLGVGLAITDGASGNLRDSAPESIVISGVNRPLFNLSPHFVLNDPDKVIQHLIGTS